MMNEHGSAPEYDRIISDPEIFGGKPIIRGMRFSVANVLNYLASGMTEEQILAKWDFLEPEDIKAALRYAAEVVDKRPE